MKTRFRFAALLFCGLIFGVLSCSKPKSADDPNRAFKADMDFVCKAFASGDMSALAGRKWQPETRKIIKRLASFSPDSRMLYLKEAAAKNGYPDFKCAAME
jgi:hypothetical protein